MTESGLYAGIDLGTTSIKVGLFDLGGRQMGFARRELSLRSPRSGHQEFDAEQFGELAFEAIRQALPSDSRRRHEVKGISVAAQAQSFVLLGADGRPVRPAVSWLDLRAGSEAEELSRLAQSLGESPLNSMASGPKLLWILRHEPEASKRARRLLLMPDYLLFGLTGRHFTDAHTAASTGLYSLRQGNWSKPLLQACGLRDDMVPAVVRPGTPAGPLAPDAARELELPESCLVSVGTNDNVACALGAGNVHPGLTSLSLGTALSVVATANNPPAQSGITVRPHPVPGLFALLLFAKTAGVVLRWLRDLLGPCLSYEQLLSEAREVPIGCGGLVCAPHFAGTATPFFDPNARGVFAGLQLHHERGHLARAVVEALAFTVQDNLELLAGAGIRPSALRAAGGGAQSDFWLQVISDACGIPVQRVAVHEAACFGAAIMAIVGCGGFPSIQEASSQLYRVERSFEPAEAAAPLYAQAHSRYQQLLRKGYP